MITLDSKLLKLRRKHRFSQTEIAEKLNVSQNAYCKWEAGKCKPNVNNLHKIAVFYNVDMFNLLDNNKEISLLNNEIGNNDIIAKASYIKISKELLEKVLQGQKNIINILEELVNL